jgi:subtilisin family serine protease
MPMRLVKPLDVVDAGAAAPTVAWGVQAVKADTSPQTGAGIKVAVLDTGIDASHVAFKDVPIVQKDFTGEGDGDQHGHGTHCAGTIFGRDVQGTRIGVARGVTDVLIGKVLGQNGGGSSDEIMQAILWAVQEGANVISMSLGMDFPGYVAALQADGMPPELATSPTRCSSTPSWDSSKRRPTSARPCCWSRPPETKAAAT